MDNKQRFNAKELEWMEGKCHNLVTNLGTKINMLKGYAAAYSNPKEGKMMINYQGVNYIIDIEPIGRENKTLEDGLKTHGFILK